jgi:ligand-binding SRPBCC domain-containing protein
MRVLKAASLVRAPRERVFSVLEDVRAADRINPGFLRLEPVRAPWLPRAGEHTTLDVEYRGERYQLTTTIAEYRRGHFLLERQTSGPFRSLEHALSLDEEGEGTRVTEVLAYQVPLGLLGALFDRLALARDLQTFLDVRQQRLSDLLVGE